MGTKKVIDNDAFFKLYIKGLNDVQIAKAFGCKKGSVCKYRLRRGLIANHQPKIKGDSEFKRWNLKEKKHCKAWRDNNKDAIHYLNKQYYVTYTDKIIEKNTEYYNKNIQKIKIRRKNYYIKNRDRLLAKQKEYSKRPGVNKRSKRIYEKV